MKDEVNPRVSLKLERKMAETLSSACCSGSGKSLSFCSESMGLSHKRSMSLTSPVTQEEGLMNSTCRIQDLMSGTLKTWNCTVKT